MKLGKQRSNPIRSLIQSLAYTRLWNESFDVMKPELWNNISRNTWDRVNNEIIPISVRREIR